MLKCKRSIQIVAMSQKIFIINNGNTLELVIEIKTLAISQVALVVILIERHSKLLIILKYSL